MGTTSRSYRAQNFDELRRYEYFRDSTVALEAFKGDQVDWRTEKQREKLGQAYDFPAVTEKRVHRRIPGESCRVRI